jgi:hypothetical protein
LFVATQVARAAGFKDPKGSIHQARAKLKEGRPISALVDLSSTNAPLDENAKRMRCTTVLFTEGEVYGILLRCKSATTEPFAGG